MSSWLHANGRAFPNTWYAEGQDPLPRFPAFRGMDSVDVCVIGAGFTGLSAALHAARAGMSVIVLEAQRVGWGASGRNGGQIGSGFNRMPDKLGPNGRALWDLAEEAKHLTYRLISDHAPNADHRAGVLSTCLTAAEFHASARTAEGMNAELGTALEVLYAEQVAAQIGTDAYAGGVLDRSAGYCNPLAYVRGVAQAAVNAGVSIFERSEVHRIGDVVATNAGRVSARFVLNATNGYGPHLTGKTAARVLPINNYIAVTEPLDTPAMPDPVAVADSRFVVNYFWQTRDNRLVYGGGESYGRKFPSPDGIEARVRANLTNVYKDLHDVRFSHAWGGTLAVTATRLPYVDEVAPGVFSAGGYSGHGLALSSLCGRACVDAMRGERGQFDLLRSLPVPALPGGRMLGPWMAQAGMLLGAISDRFKG